jgi:transposase
VSVFQYVLSEANNRIIQHIKQHALSSAQRSKEFLEACLAEDQLLEPERGTHRPNLLNETHLEQITQFVKQGYTQIKIAQYYNCDRTVVARFLRKNNLDKKQDLTVEAVQALVNEGYTDNAIARKLNYSQGSIQRFRSTHKIKKQLGLTHDLPKEHSLALIKIATQLNVDHPVNNTRKLL